MTPPNPPLDIAALIVRLRDLAAWGEQWQATLFAKTVREAADALYGWHQAALAVGEHIGTSGPRYYYTMSAEEWRTWAIAALSTSAAGEKEQHAPATPEAQSDLVGEIDAFLAGFPDGKPAAGFRFGELLQRARDALREREAEIARLSK